MRSTINGAPGANFALAGSPAKATPRTSSKPQVQSEGAGVESWWRGRRRSAERSMGGADAGATGHGLRVRS
jgi:hypothetical protein